MKREKTHTWCGGFSESFFTIKLVKIEISTLFWPTDSGYGHRCIYIYTHIYIHIYIYILYVYIYIYAVKLKSGPMFALFKVKKWSIFLFSLFFVFENLVLPAERRGF